MLGLSPSIKISISSKNGHSTFVLSSIDMPVSVLPQTYKNLVDHLHTLCMLAVLFCAVVGLIDCMALH